MVPIGDSQRLDVRTAMRVVCSKVMSAVAQAVERDVSVLDTDSALQIYVAIHCVREEQLRKTEAIWE